MSAATVVSASGVWKIDYEKSKGKEEGRKGKREGGERIYGGWWLGSFHDSVELQPCCLGGGEEGEWQILDHVDQALPARCCGPVRLENNSCI